MFPALLLAAWLPLAATQGETGQPLASLITIRLAIDEGRYSAAVVDARARVQTLGPSAGPAYHDALDLLVEASCRDGDASPETYNISRRALQWRRQHGPALAHVGALRSAACLQFIRGDTAATIRTLTDASRLAVTAGSPAAVTDDIQAALADALIEAGRFADAERRAVAARPDAARAMLLRGEALHRLGRYAEARPLVTRGIEMAERARNPEVRVQAVTLAGDQAWFEGDLPAARQHYVRAMALAEATFRPAHPSLCEPLLNLAAAQEALGDTAGARRFRERAVHVAEEALGPAHPLVALALGDLASSHVREGDHPAALRLYRRSLDIRQRRLGPNHVELATVWHNISYAQAGLGDWREARRAHDKAADIWRRALGPAHPHLARAHITLAQALEDAGQLTAARVWYRRALRIQERVPGQALPDVADTLTRLAAVALKLGSPAEGRALAERAVAAADSGGVAGAEVGARALEVQGDALAAMGVGPAAESVYRRALEATESVFGAAHTSVSAVRFKLARVLLQQGRRDAALEAALASARLDQDLRQNTIRYLPERQALSYLARQPKSLDLVVEASLGEGLPAMRTRDALDVLIRSRGAVLDEVATRRSVVAGAPSGAARSAWDGLRAARERLAQFAVSGAGSASLADELRQARDEAERRLAEVSVAVRADDARTQAGLSDVMAHLPEGAALVSFYRYRHGAGLAYAAFVSRRDGSPPTLVSLGEASVIETAVARWRRALIAFARTRTTGLGPTTRAGRTLAALVWIPVAHELAGVERVFIVPDGALHQVSFAALPLGDGRYLLEAGPVTHTLSTERDLLPAPGAVTGSDLLAMGAPAFGRGTVGCATTVFAALPGAAREVADVASLWRQSRAAGRGDPEVLTGTAATEARFKALAPGRRILHLATHGFVAMPTCEVSGGGTRAVGAVAVVTPTRLAGAGVLLDAPLAGPGLALAGANQARRGRPADDGILTAEEIVGLNLQGTEWAVLSACDTGLGEIRAGEGVFGLRRAFQIAGARTVIMSLWSVDDQATRQWMNALYKGRLEAGLSTVDAVRNASLALLRDRRAKGLSTNPFYWAAFVAAGDWR